MTDSEVATDYERNAGLVIVETFRALGLSPDEVGAALVANHGPFVWSDDPMHAVEAARVLDTSRRFNLAAAPDQSRRAGAGRFLIDKHYLRKHGVQGVLRPEAAVFVIPSPCLPGARLPSGRSPRLTRPKPAGSIPAPRRREWAPGLAGPIGQQGERPCG